MSVEFDHQMSENVDIQDGVQNGNELFSVESNENTPVKEDRVIKKAKRTIKRSPSKEDGVVNLSGTSDGFIYRAPIVSSKNSRKPRNGFGRGEPKKGGAGGKGVWGKLGDELYVNGVADERDPNYDSDSAENTAIVIKKTELKLEGPDVDKAVLPIIREYLEHGESNEVLDSLKDMNIAERYRVAELAVSLALEHHNPQRELTSRLISDIYGEYLDQATIARGFDAMLYSLNDLSLDTPDAPVVLGQFIARAVADDCLPPKFVSSYKGKLECPLARSALDKADLLLGIKHGIVRLDNVWGEGGGNRPVKYLIRRMNLLLKEYLSSGDIAEATRCLKELDVPHFHHELVYEAVLMAIEESKERATDMIIKLIQSLYITNIITPDQMNQGVKRIFDAMPELCIDVPAAYNILESMGNKMFELGVLSEALYKDLPSRGRKRFVSEGDGGRIKEDPYVPIQK